MLELAPKASRQASLPGLHLLGVDLRLEAYEALAAEIEHRALDHRGLRHHQGERLLLVQALLLSVRQFLERRAGPIEQGLPADFVAPGLQLFLGNALALVVVKIVGHAVAVEPGAGLLHGVTVLDAVDRDGQSRPSRAVASSN